MYFQLAKINRFGLVSLFVLFLGISVFGQFGSGLQGTLTDQNGAIIPGANITLTNISTNQIIETNSNDSGIYRFTGLSQGIYKVLVTQSGFKKKLIEKVVISAESVAGLDISLETGEITAQVTVDGSDSPALETESANIGKNITNKEVLQLPQVGRDPYQLARLAPGVFGDGARAAGGGANRIGNNGTGPGGSGNGIFAVENQTQISANGQRVTSNNYEIDGVSVNSQTWGGAAVITPTQESISEVQVSSSTYSAEDGRNSGAQVKVITKYGTNNWQGSAFFKINNPGLNAFNSFRGINGVAGLTGLNPTRVNDKFKTYGGSFGGPIVKDKLFFFFAYEGTQNATSSVTGGTFVETEEFRQRLLNLRAGTLSAKMIANGATPRISQILTPACSLLNSPYSGGGTKCQVVGNGLDIGSITGTYGTYVPDASNDVGGGLDGIADLQYVTLESRNNFLGNQYTGRIDFQATEKDKFSFTTNFTPLSAFGYNTAAQSRPQADLNSDRLTYLIGGIYTRTISSTMINEFRFNLTNWNYNELEANPDTEWGLPRVEIEAIWGDRLRFGAPRAETTPGFFNQRQMDFRNTLTNIAGNHTLKFGVEYRKEINTSASPGGARPLYSFTRMWNFANGTPVFQSMNADATGKPKANDVPFNTGNICLFIQDNWKFKQNLTLNL
ncbi:MAG: carboxypeptidase-like regulatory domain-containing protein, partial [Acidobacteriota bacterium]